MRERSMLYKTSNILKNSFLSLGLAYLLSSTALAQSPLDAANEAPASDSALEMPAVDSQQIPAGEENNNGPLLQDNEFAPLGNNGGLIQPQDDTVGVGLDSSQNNMNGEENNNAPLDANQENDVFGNIGNEPDYGNPDGNQNPENGGDEVLKAYNSFVESTERQAFENPETGATFGDKIMDQVKEDLFSQMADIEKQTSLLTLELKREKIKNEIAAMHAARQKAIEEQKEKQLEKERRQKEWEREQERKLLEEKQKLKETEIKFEKLRQERVLKAYKENMLKTNQEWVDYNARLYNQLIKEENEQNKLISDQKDYFKNLVGAISDLTTAAQQAKERHTREVANLQTQVAILKSKLEAEKSAFEESKKSGPNPFALVEEDDPAAKQKISEEYAIMEISGKGENLVAKLINKSGGTFMVKPGTILNTGHVIEEITQTYIVTDKSGIKDYLYFSAGGILDKEPTKTINATPKASSGSDNEEENESPIVPGLREGMFVE